VRHPVHGAAAFDRTGTAGPIDSNGTAMVAYGDRARLASLSRTRKLHVDPPWFGVTGQCRLGLERPQLARRDVHDRLPVRCGVTQVELVPRQFTQPRRLVVVENVQPTGALVVGHDEQLVTHQHGMHKRGGVVG